MDWESPDKVGSLKNAGLQDTSFLRTDLSGALIQHPVATAQKSRKQEVSRGIPGTFLQQILLSTYAS